MQQFRDVTRHWFSSAFEGPTPVQEQGWKSISEGNHSLLIAPTGSGKTLAAFLWAIDRLTRLEDDAEPGVRVLYVSPLKALVYDIERNLRAPLAGIQRAAEIEGTSLRIPSVDIRTGDTPQKDRRRQIKNPGEILVTTPESLFLLLGSQARETLRSVEWVIVDEVHAMAPTKRGAHLALSLERLSELADRDPQRIGLSATARPAEEVARFLGGHRPVHVVNTHVPPNLDLQVIVPVDDMTRPAPVAPVNGSSGNATDDSAAASDSRLAHVPEAEAEAEAGAEVESGAVAEAGAEADGGGGSLLLAEEEAATRQYGIWPAIYPQLLDLIRAHRTTILFVNSRGLCERLAQQLNDLAEEDLVRAHHGSLAHGQRKIIEESLKAGELRAIVATSSLELGIDMGTVDLVILVESPGSVASGLQRVGRSGHGVGETSIGRVFPKHRGDLLEAAVVGRRMKDGAIEALTLPRNPLDVVAQQVVAMAAVQSWDTEALARVIRRAANFRDLPDSALQGVLDMLSGLYPSHDFADLRPRIKWDRERDVIEGRRGARMLAAVNAGTIPDRGLYGVYLGADGPRVGELDEEMVHESTTGQNFTLGASTWKIQEITRDRVIVEPAPGEPGRLPFWHGDGPGRPLELGKAVGAFVREMGSLGKDAALERMQDGFDLDPRAAGNLWTYLEEQSEATGTLPTDRDITIERFRDELGDWRICILSPFGARVHAPWALALRAAASASVGYDVQTVWSDDGIVLTVADGDDPPGPELLVPEADDVEERVLEELARSPVFASQFRENAARSLLLPRRRPGARTPLFAQRLRAQKLMSIAMQFPSFPVVMETYRACLQDVFDVPALKEVLGAIEGREIRVHDVETMSASPFARSLVFAYVAAYLYEGDSPAAERRAQALSLDMKLLRELLGEADLRELLDLDVLEEVEANLQWTSEHRRARNPDALHDLLRSAGDLSPAEISERTAEDPTAWLEELRVTRRASPSRVAGRDVWIALEDTGLYRDALGTAPPRGVPQAFLASVARPLEALLLRWARTHGPFTTTVAARRFGLEPARVEAMLGVFSDEGRLLHGEFRPGSTGPEWCDPDVLRQIKRRTLAKLRGQVAPMPREALARFLPAWHGVGDARRQGDRLEDVLIQLEGLPLSYKELERTILPSRVPGFRPEHLDELGAMGWLVWVGHSPLRSDDGRVALYRRERVSRMLVPPNDDALPEVADDRHRGILEHLSNRGASFFTELDAAVPDAESVDVMEALWDLVWAGFVTNDTFQALRGLANRRHARRRSNGRGRGGRARRVQAGGRWSLVRDLVPAPAADTERAHALATTLLERHGILTRESVAIEGVEGGFSAVYRVLRTMEEAGKVRRGYFVEGLGGAQFAYPGTVDRLRRIRDSAREGAVHVLSATDPAQPYGWLIPWPEYEDDGGKSPRRVAGATVVLVDGAPVLYLARGARKLRIMADAVEGAIDRAMEALPELARRRPRRRILLEKVNGETATSSPFVGQLESVGFVPEYRALRLHVP